MRQPVPRHPRRLGFDRSLVRVLTRTSDVEGLIKPTWEEVLEREYHPWNRPHLVVDSAGMPAAQAAGRIATEVARARLLPPPR